MAAAGASLQVVATICIFTISGLLLQRGEAAAAVRSVGALAYGLAAILLLTPLLGRAALALPLQPAEGALGLAVFCCMPTTLSTGVTLTTAAGGNTAVALLLTVASNMLGVFTIPPMLALVLGSGGAAGAALDVPRLFRSLLATVLAPLLAGTAAQAYLPGQGGALCDDWLVRMIALPHPPCLTLAPHPALLLLLSLPPQACASGGSATARCWPTSLPSASAPCRGCKSARHPPRGCQ